MTIFDRFHALTITTKIAILYVVDVLDPTIITDIFGLQSWILFNFNQFSLFIEIVESIVIKIGGRYAMGIY